MAIKLEYEMALICGKCGLNPWNRGAQCIMPCPFDRAENEKEQQDKWRIHKARISIRKKLGKGGCSE